MSFENYISISFAHKYLSSTYIAIDTTGGQFSKTRTIVAHNDKKGCKFFDIKNFIENKKLSSFLFSIKEVPERSFSKLLSGAPSDLHPLHDPA